MRRHSLVLALVAVVAVAAVAFAVVVVVTDAVEPGEAAKVTLVDAPRASVTFAKLPPLAGVSRLKRCRP